MDSKEALCHIDDVTTQTVNGMMVNLETKEMAKKNLVFLIKLALAFNEKDPNFKQVIDMYYDDL